MDLVGPGPVAPHFDDAVAAVRGLSASGRWADLGSGAGFPGIALAATFGEAEVVLVERRQKRAAFLRAVVHEAQLDNASVLQDAADSLPGAGFDGVISRAYKPPEAYLGDCARLLRPGGIAVVLTAGSWPPAPAGFVCVSAQQYTIEGKPRAAARYCKSP